MNKRQFSMILLGMMTLMLHAEDVITVQELSLRPGDTQTTMVELSTWVSNYRGFQADILLPSGMTITKMEDVGRGVEEADVNKKVGSATEVMVGEGIMNKQVVVFAMGSNFRVGDGSLVSLSVKADDGIAEGTYKGYLQNVKLSYATGTTVSCDDVQFDIVVYNGRLQITLDESYTEAPTTIGEPVDVHVSRTINANEWSTICLPFSMTEEQVKTAFGEDVRLADFTGWSSDEDDEGDIVGILVRFTTITEVEANHPCLIKVPDAVTSFNVENVYIEVEDEPVVQVGKKKVERGFFTGTYVADTTVPENNLFLYGNKFYYSVGLTKMKAFRAYFEFYDVLSSVEGSSTKIRYVIDDVSTAVNHVEVGHTPDGIYTLQGLYLGKDVDAQQLPKGVYVINGKKTIIK